MNITPANTTKKISLLILHLQHFWPLLLNSSKQHDGYKKTAFVPEGAEDGDAHIRAVSPSAGRPSLRDPYLCAPESPPVYPYRDLEYSIVTVLYIPHERGFIKAVTRF